MFLTKSPEALGRRRTSAGMAVATAGKQLALFYRVQKGSLSGAQRPSTSAGQRSAAGRISTGQTNKDSKSLSAEQISAIDLAFVQVKSAIHLDGIWHLNHSQVLCLTRFQEGGQRLL